MEDFKKVEDLVDHVREYVHVRVDEARLGLADRSSGVIATIIAGAVLTGIITLAFVFVLTAAALLLGRVLNDLVLGFLIIAGFLTVIGLIVWWGKERLIRIPVMNVILHELFETENNEKN